MTKRKKNQSGIKSINPSSESLNLSYHKKQAKKTLEKAKILEKQNLKTKRWVLLPDGKTKVLR